MVHQAHFRSGANIGAQVALVSHQTLDFEHQARQTSRRAGFRAKDLPHFHERETEKIKPPPLFRAFHPGVLLGQTYAPDRVHGIGLNQNLLAGVQEVGAQGLVQAELRNIAADHDIETACRPFRHLEILHPAAQRLGGGGTWRAKNFRQNGAVAEQACFLRHHIVLGRRIADAADFEFALPPLA